MDISTESTQTQKSHRRIQPSPLREGTSGTTPPPSPLSICAVTSLVSVVSFYFCDFGGSAFKQGLEQTPKFCDSSSWSR